MSDVEMGQSAEYARLYLDVDGVLNAVTRRVPDWGWERQQTEEVNGYPINWSPDLIDVLNRVSKTPGLGVYWLTTWCDDAPTMLAPVLGLDGAEWPVVGYEHWRDSRSGLPWWKHLAIVEHLAGFDGGVLWIDDDHGVDSVCRAWLAGQPQVLAMAPATSVGITRAEAELIERFAADLAPTYSPGGES